MPSRSIDLPQGAKLTMQFEKLRGAEPVVETEMFGKKTNFAACLDVADRVTNESRLRCSWEIASPAAFSRTYSCLRHLVPENQKPHPGKQSRVGFCTVILPLKTFTQPTGADGKVARSGHLHRSRINAARRPDSRHRPSFRDLPENESFRS